MKRKIKLIHCTKVKNLSSIKKFGLCCYLPYLTSHLRYVKENIKKDAKIIYTFPFSDKLSNLKFIQDYVFFQCWGKPRNLFSQKWEGDWNKDFWKEIDKLSLDLSEYTFLNFEIEIPSLYFALHDQDDTGCIKGIPDKYIHLGRSLCFVKRKVESREIKFMGYARPILRNNSINNIKILN